MTSRNILELKRLDLNTSVLPTQYLDVEAPVDTHSDPAALLADAVDMEIDPLLAPEPDTAGVFMRRLPDDPVVFPVPVTNALELPREQLNMRKNNQQQSDCVTCENRDRATSVQA